MDNREAAIATLMARIKTNSVALGLKRLKLTPTSAAAKEDCPAVYLHEGDDEVMNESNGSWHGFPKVRQLQLIFEMWVVGDNAAAKTFFKQVRALVFSEKIDGVGMSELKTFGPYSNGIHDMRGMQLVMGIIYHDVAPEQ